MFCVDESLNLVAEPRKPPLRFQKIPMALCPPLDDALLLDKQGGTKIRVYQYLLCDDVIRLHSAKIVQRVGKC